MGTIPQVNRRKEVVPALRFDLGTTCAVTYCSNKPSSLHVKCSTIDLVTLRAFLSFVQY